LKHVFQPCGSYSTLSKHRALKILSLENRGDSRSLLFCYLDADDRQHAKSTVQLFSSTS
jgi:hypothetical protein